MTSDLTLRPLVPDDAEAAAALIRVAFAAQPIVTRPPSSALRESTETIAAWIGSGGGAGLWDGSDLVALLLWAQRDGGLYCGRLAVRPDCRGQGLARRLIAAAEGEARHRALSRVDVRVRLELPDNVRLFRSCGFAEIGRDAHPGFTMPTILLLQKRLDRPGS